MRDAIIVFFLTFGIILFGVIYYLAKNNLITSDPQSTPAYYVQPRTYLEGRSFPITIEDCTGSFPQQKVKPILEFTANPVYKTTLYYPDGCYIEDHPFIFYVETPEEKFNIRITLEHLPHP